MHHPPPPAALAEDGKNAPERHRGAQPDPCRLGGTTMRGSRGGHVGATMTRPRAYLQSRRHRSLRMMPEGCLPRCRTTLPPARTCRTPAGRRKKAAEQDAAIGPIWCVPDNDGDNARRSVQVEKGRSGAIPWRLPSQGWEGAASSRKGQIGDTPRCGARGRTRLWGCGFRPQAGFWSQARRPNRSRLHVPPAPGTPARKMPAALRQRRSAIVGGQMRRGRACTPAPTSPCGRGARGASAPPPSVPDSKGRARVVHAAPAGAADRRPHASISPAGGHGILALRTAPGTCNPPPL